jgi:hypothetical protein
MSGDDAQPLAAGGAAANGTIALMTIACFAAPSLGADGARHRRTQLIELLQVGHVDEAVPAKVDHGESRR